MSLHRLLPELDDFGEGPVRRAALHRSVKQLIRRRTFWDPLVAIVFLVGATTILWSAKDLLATMCIAIVLLPWWAFRCVKELRESLRNERGPRGYCIKCGYDVMATPGRNCPECGYPPPASHQNCVHCRANLTGNVSGVCPECGTAIEKAESKP